MISYLRTAMSGGSTAVVVCNFTPAVRRNYRVGVPAEGFYAERLNTDSMQYGGSDPGNTGGVWADPEPLHGRLHSINFALPPFAALILQCADAPPRG